MNTRLKHRWSLSHNYLAGITADKWWRLLRENRFSISPAYWHRAALVSALGLMNSWHARRESRLYAEKIEETSLPEAPVFILGHWRSGTTHLHNLLAQDDIHFAYANTYQVINPLTFLTTEEANTRRFARLLPAKRPMDNMPLRFDSPQEDEFAPLLMSLLSPYLSVSFPRREGYYDRYLTFHDVSSEERGIWKDAFLHFLKKLTYKYGRTLLLKSPSHTARIALLRELFPDAKFIHIHRHPAEVFQSTRHFHDTATWHTYLQVPDRTRTDERILTRYRTLYDAFLEDRSQLPSDRFAEIAYSDLEKEPIAVIASLYEHLDLGDFSLSRPKIVTYLDSLKDYRKNHFGPLDDASLDLIRTRWEPVYRHWGYRL